MQLLELSNEIAAIEQLLSSKSADALVKSAMNGPGAIRRRAIDALVSLGKLGLNTAISASKAADQTEREAGLAVLAAFIQDSDTSPSHKKSAKTAILRVFTRKLVWGK